MTRYKEEHQIVMKKENSFGLDERIFISTIGCNDMESNRIESNQIHPRPGILTSPSVKFLGLSHPSVSWWAWITDESTISICSP